MKTSILTFTVACRAVALCVGGSLFLSVVARAELNWEQQTIELHPAIGDKTAVAHFKYDNVGKAPVHFKSVRASCGCTTTQSQKEVVNPGEKGEITATYNIGDHTGLQTKTVTVETDDPNPAQATSVLTLSVHIPEALEIKPTFVYWQSGEEPKPKKISIKASKDFPAKNITVKSNSPDFESKVEPGSATGEWTIEVKPKDTSKAASTALVVESDFPREAPKSFMVTAQVNRPPGPPPLMQLNRAPLPAPAKSPTPATTPTSATGPLH